MKTPYPKDNRRLKFARGEDGVAYLSLNDCLRPIYSATLRVHEEAIFKLMNIYVQNHRDKIKMFNK